MNEYELKNYLSAQEILINNIVDSHVFRLQKNDEDEIFTENLEINNENIEIIINFSFEKYFLDRRNIRGATNISRIEISNYLNSEIDNEAVLIEKANRLKDGFSQTLRKNQDLVLVILLFQVEENQGLLFLTFSPEEYLGIVNNEINMSLSFDKIKKGFITLVDEDVLLLIDNQNAQNPADYFENYLGCILTKQDKEITKENREEIFAIVNNLLPRNIPIQRRIKSQIYNYITAHNGEEFNITSLITYLTSQNNEDDEVPNNFYNLFQNQFNENIRILTKDFKIKIDRTYEKVKFRINNESDIVITVIEKKVSGFEVNDENTKLTIEIDTNTARRIREIKRKYSS